MLKPHNQENEKGSVARRLTWLALVLAMSPLDAHGAELSWAFPAPDKVQPTARENGRPTTLAGSRRSYTQAEIDNLKLPPDWFPEMHPSMPPIVAEGVGTFACASCHLPTGTGHDESAYLAGLPASYIVGQMADFKNGMRRGFGDMPAIAHSLNDSEIQSAAQYFASLPARRWVRVVETESVPKSYVNSSKMRLVLADGGPEPIGDRIVELPEDESAAISRDPRSGFVAYVPMGSLAEGGALVTTGGGKTTACVACHGPTLKGLGDVPAIAGRHTGYIARQLHFFQSGERSGPMASVMRDVAASLTAHDMLVISGYLASLEP